MRPKPMKPAVRVGGADAGAQRSVVIGESWGPQKEKGDQTKLGHWEKKGEWEAREWALCVAYRTRGGL